MTREIVTDQPCLVDNNNLILADSLRTGAWGIAALTTKAISGVLPHNFDPSLHAGNLGMTMGAMMLTIGALRMHNHDKLTSEPEAYHSFMKKALLVGVVASVAANVAAELSPVVEHLYGRPTTPDIQDFAYGMVGGYIGVRMMTRRFKPAKQPGYSTSPIDTVRPANMRAEPKARRNTSKPTNLRRMQNTSKRKNRR